jgi:hypothetical protein
MGHNWAGDKRRLRIKRRKKEEARLLAKQRVRADTKSGSQGSLDLEQPAGSQEAAPSQPE